MFNCLGSVLNESDWWFKFEFSAPRLQVVYQVGVLISRTSVSVVHIKHFWILAILQVSVSVVHIFWILAMLKRRWEGGGWVQDKHC